MLNPTLSFADWHTLRNLDSGMHDGSGKYIDAKGYEVQGGRTRIVTLNPSQPIFRWIDSKAVGTAEDLACGPWWSTKRGAQKILRQTEAEWSSASPSTAEKARAFSNVARNWSDGKGGWVAGGDMGKVVAAMVTAPIKCFLGVGRKVNDGKTGEVWDSRELQLYIPNLSFKHPTGKWTLSPMARQHLRVLWVKPADEFRSWIWHEIMDEREEYL